MEATDALSPMSSQVAAIPPRSDFASVDTSVDWPDGSRLTVSIEGPGRTMSQRIRLMARAQAATKAAMEE